MNENELTLKESKQSKLKLWFATLCVALFSGLLAFCSYLTKNYIQSKAISYNDNEYKIVLNQNELDNYSFQNLLNYIYSNEEQIENSQDISFNIDYIDHLNESQTINLSLDGQSQNDLSFTYNSGQIEYVNGILLTNVSNYKFYVLNNQDNTVNFENVVDYIEYEEGTQSDPEFYLKTTQTFYSGMKNAIELDIQANNPSTQDILSSILSEIISLLTGGIIGLSGGIGSGVSTLVTDIFISNSALSVFGGIIVVFAGVSLAIGLCRWIMNFLTSLGAKK